MRYDSYRRSHPHSHGGGAVIFVILLLIVGAAAAYWFLFRVQPGPALPAGATPQAVSSQPDGGSTLSSDPALSDMTATPLSSSGTPLPVTATGEVDWNERYKELHEKYSREFAEPKVGTDVKLMLTSGKIVGGRISDITPDRISVRVGTGHATYVKEQLSSQSQLFAFKAIYAEYGARTVLAKERMAAQPVVGAQDGQ